MTSEAFAGRCPAGAPEVLSEVAAGVAQLVRACGSYPQGPGFKSLHRHQFSMHPLARRVAGTVSARRLYLPTDRVAVALSGGPDSVALAWILTELAARGGAALAGVIHVNHQLRGARVGRRRAFCLALAARAGWPIECVRVDAAADGADAARVDRSGGARRAIPRPATTRPDAWGRRSSRPAIPSTIRPRRCYCACCAVPARAAYPASGRAGAASCVRRSTAGGPILRRALEARGEAFREDSSNLTLTIPRNRIRHDVLPRLEAIAPGCTAALARLPPTARTTSDFFLTPQSNTGRRSSYPVAMVSTPGPAAITVSAARLASLPPAIGRRLIRDVASDVAPQAALSARHIEAVWTLARADSAWRARRSARDWWLTVRATT